MFVALFQSLHDIERQASAITRLLVCYPQFKTRCCQSNYCYSCKISSFHKGVTCEQRMRQEKMIDVQCCPTCQVPTIKSEGCSSIQCLCGHSWRWKD